MRARVAAAVAASVISALAALLLSTFVDLASRFFLGRTALVWLLPLAGLATYALYRIVRLPFGLGTVDIVQELRSGVTVPSLLAPSVFLGTCATVLCGGSVGKEAAALQVAAASASKVGDVLNVDRSYRDTLALCGMASALSVLLGAPLAGALFAVELVGYRVKSASRLLAVVLSAYVAKALAYAVAADSLVFPMLFPAVGFDEGKWLLAMMACEAVIALALCFSLKYGRVFLGKLKIPYPVRLILGGLAVAAVLSQLQLFAYSGTGMSQVYAALAGSAEPFFFLGKMCLTVFLLVCGFKGGEIMPVLCIGATFGCFFAQSVGLPPSLCAALGLVGLLSACTNCPLSAIALGCESFGLSGLGWYIVAACVPFALTCWFSLYGNIAAFDAVKRRFSRLAGAPSRR